MAAMTAAEREDFLFGLQMVEALEIAAFVFDAAADRVRNVRTVLAAFRTSLNAEENS